MNKAFKKPDLTAPRCLTPGIHKIIARAGKLRPDTNNKFLKEFTDKHPQYNTLTKDQAVDILEKFHGKIWDHALNNRDGVELPESLGFIFLGTCAPAKKYNVDFGALNKDDIKVRHRNFESDSKLAKIFYTNFANKYKFKNREMWYFTATRDFKRGVAPIYREHWKRYVEVENGRNISNYMKKASKNEFFRKRAETYVADASYNEFDLN